MNLSALRTFRNHAASSSLGWRHGARTQVEQCIALSLSWLLQHNYLELAVGQMRSLDLTWRNLLKEPIYGLVAEIERSSNCIMQLCLYSTQQVVYLRPTDLHFGGMRWWFGCPGCGRRCAKLYLLASVFLCRLCHDLTYQSCIEGKSTTAFLARIAAELGYSVADVKSEIARDTRERNKWRRKRDRRVSHKGRGWFLRELQEEGLKRRTLEAKAILDLAKAIGRP